MAYFDTGSRTLVEILNNLQGCSDGSVEKPTVMDHSFYELGSVRYHIQVLASDPANIYLSILIPPLSLEVPHSNGLPDRTLQDIRRMYSNVAEIMEPPKEGFILTLKLNFGRLPRSEDRIKAVNEISSLQAAILSSQLKDLLWNLDSMDMLHGTCRPIKVVYYPQEPFFVSRRPEKITAIFPMRFKDNSDVVLATSFFQELMDLGDSASFSKAPHCTWSPIPPSELRGENFQYLTTNGGFVSFDIFSRHVKGEKLEKTVWILLNFYAHVKYHIKSTRGFIQRRMRQRQERLAELQVIRQSRIREGEGKKELQSRNSLKKLMSFSKHKKLKTGCIVITDQIKRLRSRIKIKGLDRLRRRWFRVPKFPALRKYSKLD
ncbi:actin-related protein 2/3 complex subunit 2B isoform X2 [Typha angustifolia]|uniref:actin-related protein 2/3 complex subunit 2B isoform X2 n=1 Tax=Typha angustifolia TaxID=59011 RepID=UPI003C3016A5